MPDCRESTSSEAVSQTAIANFLIVARSQRQALAVTDDRFRLIGRAEIFSTEKSKCVGWKSSVLRRSISEICSSTFRNREKERVIALRIWKWHIDCVTLCQSDLNNPIVVLQNAVKCRIALCRLNYSRLIVIHFNQFCRLSKL